MRQRQARVMLAPAPPRGRPGPVAATPGRGSRVGSPVPQPWGEVRVTEEGPRWRDQARLGSCWRGGSWRPGPGEGACRRTDALWVRLRCRPCCRLGVGAGFSDTDPGQTTEGPPLPEGGACPRVLLAATGAFCVSGQAALASRPVSCDPWTGVTGGAHSARTARMNHKNELQS